MAFGSSSNVNGLTPLQEQKIDQINSKLDVIIGNFGPLAELIGGLKALKLQDDPKFSGIYNLALDLYEKTLKVVTEVTIDQIKK